MIDKYGIDWWVSWATDGNACIVGEHDEYGSCLWLVNDDAEIDISMSDTDGDFDGDGWPSPPEELVAKAAEIVGAAMDEVEDD